MTENPYAAFRCVLAGPDLPPSESVAKRFWAAPSIARLDVFGTDRRAVLSMGGGQ